MNETIDGWARAMRDSIDQMRKLESELTPEQLRRRPADGGWSIAQVFEHLVLIDSPYLDLIPPLVTDARPGGPWKPTFMGRLIARAVAPEAARRTRTSKKFVPGPEARANVIGEYIKVRERELELLEQARGADLNVKMRSPVLGLLRYNLGDAFQILVWHTQRHLGQVERIRSGPGSNP